MYSYQTQSNPIGLSRKGRADHIHTGYVETPMVQGGEVQSVLATYYLDIGT